MNLRDSVPLTPFASHLYSSMFAYTRLRMPQNPFRLLMGACQGCRKDEKFGSLFEDLK